MRLTRSLLAAILAVLLPSVALAQPHRIAELGTAPLVAPIESTAQLQMDVREKRRLFDEAGSELGLTPQEYAAFAERIAHGLVRYGTIPRHLDAMSWARGGRAYALRDVVIPAGTHGWEVDLAESDRVLALFIPAQCGNLSIVRRPRVRIAVDPPGGGIAFVPRAPKTSLLQTPAPVPVPVPVPVPEIAPSPVPTPAFTFTLTPQEQAPAHHHSSWWPLLFIPVAALFFHGHGVSAAAFTPTPASCATPAAH